MSRDDHGTALALIRGRYSEAELRHLFVKREKDWIFENLGYAASGKTGLYAIWLGFELAINSPYLEDRYC
jgi:hypothetical protein